LDTGEALAEGVRKHHLPDFSDWKTFTRTLARLEKAWRT